ncbi:MAG: TIGR03435 family protein [Terriglobales bacterium]
MHRGVAIWLAFVLAAAAAAAQAPLPPLPAFDVVSVRPFKPTAPWHRLPQYDPQRLYIEGMYTSELIREAYEVNFNHIAGLPASMAEKLFTVVGTTDKPASKEQMRLMLQRVLAERFQLVVEDTARVQPVYDLVVARGGPKLRPSQSDKDCTNGVISFDQVRALHLPPNSRLVYLGCSITALVQRLNVPTSISDRLPVLEKTGLTGRYAIALWQESGGREPSPTVPGAYRLVNLEPIGEAIKSELGLELVRSTGPYRVLTIRHIADPTPN